MATKKNASDTLRTIVASMLKGDVVKGLDFVVPEAYPAFERFDRAITGAPKGQTYAVEPMEAPDSEPRFLIRLELPNNVVQGAASMTQVKGTWKISQLELIGEGLDSAPPDSAEATIAYFCKSALNQKLEGIADLLTSEAFVDIMRITAAWGLLPPPDNYSFDTVGVEGEDHLFTLHIRSQQHEVDCKTTVRQIKGAWMIAAVKLPGVRD